MKPEVVTQDRRGRMELYAREIGGLLTLAEVRTPKRQTTVVNTTRKEESGLTEDELDDRVESVVKETLRRRREGSDLPPGSECEGTERH